MRLYACILLVAVAGCKGSGSAGTDGGGGSGGGSVSSAIMAVATCQDAIVGLRISCDGTQSSDSMGRSLMYAWAVTGTPGAPDTSTGSNATFSFAPAVAGTYEITLTVSVAGGDSNFAKAGAAATAIPLFYRQSKLTAASDSFVVGIVGSDGAGAHDLSCPVNIADASGNGDAGVANRGTYGDTPGAFGTRVWYAANQAQPARVVFENVTASEHQLLASDEDGDCSSRMPVRLDATPTVQHLVPRFSPDGSRVAWIDLGSGSGQLITAALDGSARHVVRTATKMKTAPPQWSASGRVLWVEDVSTTSTPHLQIASASDADGAGDGAGRMVSLDCNPTADANALQVINQFENVGGAWIVSGGVKSRTANPPGATILYRMGTSCSTMGATVLADEPAGGFAWDFAVSPDASTIVFAGIEGNGSSAHDLYLVPVDGSVPPSRFVGSAPGVDDIGPSWIADGKQLTWTQAATNGTATGGGVMVANRDGSSIRSVLPQGGATDGTVFVVAPTNRGLDCSVAGGGTAAGEAIFVLALVVVVRRRRRA